MSSNSEAVKRMAKDLRHEQPRSPEEKLGGFPLAARCLDKCRATLAGSQGEYTYGCPMDQQFFSAAGIGAEEFKQFVSTGAKDQEVEKWIRERSTSRN